MASAVSLRGVVLVAPRWPSPFRPGAAQEPVISRSAPMTLTGEIVEISCYKQKGVAAGTGAAHAACAKQCVADKSAALGILSDGDGLFRIWGAMARDKYAKVLPHIGRPS